jgi:hypothetical protein
MTIRSPVAVLILLAAGCDSGVKTVPLDFYPAAAAFKGAEAAVVVAGQRSAEKPASQDVHLAVVDLASGKQIAARDLGAKTAGTLKFALSEDGTLLAVERADRRIGVWNTGSGKLVVSLPGFAEKSTPFAISRNQDEVIAGAVRWRIEGAKLLGLANDRAASRLIGYTSRQALSKDERLVAIAVENVVRPDVRRPRLELRRQPGGDLAYSFDLDEPAGSMLTRISPDASLVLLENRQGATTSLTVWKTANGSKAYRIEKPAGCGFAAWSADASILLLRCVEGSDKMYLESHRVGR